MSIFHKETDYMHIDVYIEAGGCPCFALNVENANR